ncbi:MAG: MarR family winged helix-turn-helix transcriptional regulator [Lachnospiraceae bacterium]
MQEERRCGLLIRKIHTKLEKDANNAMRDADLSFAQISILELLNSVPGQQMQVKEIQKHEKLAQSTTAGLVSRIEQKGFVECWSDSEDRRLKWVKLTARGQDCCVKADERMKVAEDMLLRNLTDTEKEILLSLLQKVSNSI